MQIIKEIWEQVFKLDAVSENVNFFELGGHSLIAAKIISLLRKKHQINISVADIFAFPVLSELRREIKQRLGQKRENISLVHCDRSRDYPLSLAQKRLWFLHQLRPDLSIYSFPLYWKIHGRLNVSMLKRALNGLVARHEALRTRVKVVDGEGVQEILPRTTEFPFKEEVFDGREESALQLRIREEVSCPFDLEQDVLCRCLLLRLSKTESVLCCVFHHIIFDDWSVTVFIRDLNRYYDALVRGEEIGLKSLALQYVDFSTWETKCLALGLFDQHLLAYKNAFRHHVSCFLPFVESRPSLLSYHGRQYKRIVPSELNEALSSLAQENNVSLFILLLAAFKWSLSLFVNEEEIIVGSPVSNRPFSDQKEVIGYFVNTLVFRSSFTKEQRFKEVLLAIKKSVLEGYEWQGVPFEKIVDELDTPRELNKNPLFQVMFSIAHASEISSLTLDSLDVIALDIPHPFTKFDLSLHVQVQTDTLELQFEYLEELFDEPRILQFVEIYYAILEHITQDSEVQLASVARELCKPLTLSGFSVHEGSSVVDLLERRLLRSSGCTALTTARGTLTYGELKSHAEGVVHTLSCAGVQVWDTVSLCVDSAEDFVVGLLAILKSGASCIPLFWQHHNEQEELLNGIQPTHRLTTRPCAHSGNQSEEGVVFCCESLLDRSAQVYPMQSKAPVVHFLSNFNKEESFRFCYSHCALRASAEAAIKTLRFTEDDVILANIQGCSKQELVLLLTALISGAHLVMMSSPEMNFCDVGATFRASALFVQSGVLRDLIKTRVWYAWDSLRLVITKDQLFTYYFDEGLSFEDLDALESKRVWVPKAPFQILDDYGIPVPQGAMGEIVLNGPTVAGSEMSRRQMKTGFWGRCFTGGKVAVLGRISEQNISKGVRIFLSQLEIALLKHAKIHRAAIIQSENRVVAYLALYPEVDVDWRTLRDFIEATMEVPLFPDKIYLVDAIPCTFSGEVDVAQLIWKVGRELRPLKSTDPSEMERSLVSIWECLLKKKGVSLESNFFELGGNSLLVVQMCTQIQDKLKCMISVIDVFQYPTIKRLAAFCSKDAPSTHFRTEAAQRREEFLQAIHRRAQE